MPYGRRLSDSTSFFSVNESSYLGRSLAGTISGRFENQIESAASPSPSERAGVRAPLTPPVLFIDDGGVLNDNALRGPEWLRLIGGFMAPRLGGTAEGWARANSVEFPRVWGDIVKRLSGFATYQEFQRTYSGEWMRAMCARVGVDPPPDDAALALHVELSRHVWERANAAIPGAADAVLGLHRAGYTLYTASGQASWEMQVITEKMGIRRAFSGLYGPDLVDQVKNALAFYEKVFAHAGVPAASALVIDSEDECCRWAREAGAQALWIDPKGRGDAPTLEALVRALV